MAEDYDRQRAHAQFVDDLIRVYTQRSSVSDSQGALGLDETRLRGGHAAFRHLSRRADHRLASRRERRGRTAVLAQRRARAYDRDTAGAARAEAARKKLAEGLSACSGARCSADALRIVDKAPVNSDYLGFIHSVFPNARIIHMRRDPIDTCLSCYFQQFSTGHELHDGSARPGALLPEHQRLMAHWRSALPPGSILEVPYAGAGRRSGRPGRARSWSSSASTGMSAAWISTRPSARWSPPALAGAAEDLQPFRAALAQLREIHRSAERPERLENPNPLPGGFTG